MEIKVNQLNDRTFELVLGRQTISISIEDMERLHFQLSEILRPDTVFEKRSRHKAFLTRLKTADDSGIQALLRTAGHDDILVLLNYSEQDDELKKKLYRNMSENSMKLYVEDLMFQFKEGLPDYRFDEAMTRLLRTAEDLIEDGALTYKDV